MPEQVEGFCDLESSIPHGKLFSCPNWRPVKPEKPRHAVGVSVLLIENGALLLGKRGPSTGAAQGWLSTPGGRLEIDESFEDCARREFKEETGATLYGRLKILGYKKHFRFGEHYIMFYVFAPGHVGTIGNPEEPANAQAGIGLTRRIFSTFNRR
jgi:ADP-ribose pyrophosphatase YjhB (NUDIX family)